MGVFGGKHVDGFDLAAAYSAMVTCCDVPPGYDPGTFHLVTFGVFVRLDTVPVVLFSGRYPHAGTPPLAPPGVTKLDKSAYRCVVICYPASRPLMGAAQMPMAAKNDKEDVFMGYDMFRPTYVYSSAMVYVLCLHAFSLHIPTALPYSFTTAKPLV